MLDQSKEKKIESNILNENKNIENKDSFVLDSNENKVVYELDLDNENTSDNLVENHNYSSPELDAAPVADDLAVNNDLEKDENNMKIKESINMDSISDFQFDNQLDKLAEEKNNLESSSDSVVRDLNPEKQMLKSRERLDKLKKLTEKLRTPSGVSDLENEPAYKRASLDLNDESLKVEDETKIILDKKDGDIQIKEDNSFLHDNID